MIAALKPTACFVIGVAGACLAAFLIVITATTIVRCIAMCREDMKDMEEEP